MGDNEYTTGCGTKLCQVHSAEECKGEYCVIHNPSIPEWPTHWRDDRGFMEYICPHGVGWPAPEDSKDISVFGVCGYVKCSKIWNDARAKVQASNQHPDQDAGCVKKEEKEETTVLRDVMIDLETIGNDYDGVFTTLGACVFDRDSGSIERVFYESVNWESALEFGRTVTPSTIKWWMAQPESTRSEIVKNGLPLPEVLKQFRAWLPRRPIVWGNGPNFDIGKLETAFGYYDIPWKYYDIRCVRTIREAAEGMVDFEGMDPMGEAHNALSDALWQAKAVSLCWQALRRSTKQE